MATNILIQIENTLQTILWMSVLSFYNFKILLHSSRILLFK